MIPTLQLSKYRRDFDNSDHEIVNCQTVFVQSGIIFQPEGTKQPFRSFYCQVREKEKSIARI
jgi:hypothetical protein